MSETSIERQPVDYGELRIRLGCAGCSQAFECRSDKTPGEVLSEIRDIPHQVKGDGAMWTRSGNIACTATDACPNGEQIAERAGLLGAATEKPLAKSI